MRKKKIPDISKNTRKVEEKIKENSKKFSSSIILAVVLFVITFLIYFATESIVTVNSGEISDWRFIYGNTASAIEGNVSSYYKSNSENKIAKPYGNDYLRLNYTVNSPDGYTHFVIKTEYNPIKIVVNGEEMLDNGYSAGKIFTGNSYNEINLTAEENEIDVYMYAPLSFSVHGYAEDANSSVKANSVRYITLGIAIAVLLFGVVMIGFILVLSVGSKYNGSLLLLSSVVVLAGLAGIMYFFSQNTALLTGQIWYSVHMILKFFLMVLSYTALLSCSHKAIKSTFALLPLSVCFALAVLYPSAWVVRIVSAAFAILQIIAAVRGVKAMATVSSADVPDVGAVLGLMLYAAVIGFFNACSHFVGIGGISDIMYFYSIAMVIAVTYVIFCRRIVYLDIRKVEQEKQFRADKEWIKDVTALVSDFSDDVNQQTFLAETAQGIAGIISKNANSDVEDVHYSIGVKNGESFTELCSSGVEECDYALVYEHLTSKEKKLIIGSRTIDLLFDSDAIDAIVHFENIPSGVTPMLENIIESTYPRLYVTYHNIGLKQDMVSVQEELFVNLATIVDERDQETQHHQMNVSILTYNVCKFLGMSEKKSKLVSMAAMTHDIGKIAIPEHILKKKGKLTESEFTIMKEHVLYGKNIMSTNSGEFFDVAQKIAEQHHENYDGTGYLGIKGRNIDPGARIVRVVDAMDALLSKRDYKEAWEKEKVSQYFADNKGTLFDPVVVKAVINNFDELYEIRRQIETEE